MTKKLVSICIITYNHEDYITKTIEQCLEQKTSFDFEILIHDDHSSDDTIQILKKFKDSFPDKITLILEKVNQYSQGKKMIPLFSPYVKGKYIAMIEGDDYWSDEYKLQKQVDFMEKNEDYSLVLHRAKQINSNHKVMFNIGQSEDCDYSTEEIIEGGGGMFATNSILFKSEFLTTLPDYFHEAPVGDYPLVIYLSTVGKVHYMSENMSVYRYATNGSWTEKYSKDANFFSEHINLIIEMLNRINAFYNFRYNEVILHKIHLLKLQKLIYYGEYRLIKETYNDYYKHLSSKEKSLLWLRGSSPFLYRILFTLKNGK